MNDILYEITDTELFNRMKQNYFLTVPDKEINFSLRYKECLYKLHLPLPAEYNEIFIRYEEALIYWLLDIKAEEFIRIYNRYQNPEAVENYRLLKDYYSRWVFSVRGEERRSNAGRLKHLINKLNDKNSIPAMVFSAMLGIYEPGLGNNYDSSELLSRAAELAGTGRFSDNASNEFRFLVYLFMGFENLVSGKPDKARKFFNEALTINPSNITCKFHLALAEARNSSPDIPVVLLKEIFNYDLSRAQYALTANPAAIDYFLRNSYTAWMFCYPEFANYSGVLENYFSGIETGGAQLLTKIKEIINDFSGILAENKISPELEKPILILRNILNNPGYERSIILKGNSGIAKQIFNEAVNQAICYIKTLHTSRIHAPLAGYDKELSQISSLIEEGNEKFRRSIDKSGSEHEEKINKIKNETAEKVASLEDNLRKLNEEGQSSSIIFLNAMTYNTIISLVIFFLGGCAGYTGSYIEDVNGLNSLFFTAVLSGLKWGIVAFLAGVIISILYAGAAVIEKMNKKQNILNRITRIKNNKEKIIRELKIRAEQSEKYLTQEYEEEIKSLRKKLEEVSCSRSALEIKLKADAESKIASEAAPLKALILT
jgi:hypothetical protein